MEVEIEIRVIDCLLENLTVHFEERGAAWFGLVQCFADCLLKQTRIDSALDPDEETELPVGAGASRFLCEPDVQLPARQRKGTGVKFHPIAPTQKAYALKALSGSGFRIFHGRISVRERATPVQTTAPEASW
ncbi:hypothetical protein MSTO_42680 [Mycobacterium stomatepiae]|uniref:Uncharacterized protein n=1 Tax=Mycobacterium stomatepiae TaxID=470076 RepID=A0A7I7QCM0_9MYCO|nr:hypothetical protein MSTO_42680 [Mycobacterium stomatepiae]